ncbi:MAG TPA: DUF3179 domain-containing (seleno)protein [Candidatus Binataceae bacterium]|nr:DUF3179 domain-containing (seleno)protein [Candidatus Binataceae bacterium]
MCDSTISSQFNSPKIFRVKALTPAAAGVLLAALILALPSGARCAKAAGSAPKIVQAALIKEKIEGIEHPKFVAAKDAAFLQPRDRVIGVVIDNVPKAYPLRILRWHQVINDVTAGKPVAVTYCPLTSNTAAYIRKVGGRTLTLFPTDKLYESSTLFRDGSTHSLWSQFNGKAIVGPEKGKQLQPVASIDTDWMLWNSFHPKTQVLAFDQGFARNYEVDPYTQYEGLGATQFPVSNQDQRLPRNELVLGVDVDHHAEAFPLRRLVNAKTPMTVEVGGKKITVVFDPATATAGAADDKNHIPAYTGEWFGWAAFHPNSEIWGKEPPKPPPPLPIIFKDAGDLNHAREANSATLLTNGKVLIAGGDNGRSPMIAAAELYDPAKHAFTTTGSMKSPRGAHTATLLADGRVLITGGMDDLKTIANAEIYDPATGEFTAIEPMHLRREKHTATLLKNGHVLIAGGYEGDAYPSATTELFDPSKGKFVEGPAMTVGRQNHSATMLPDGRVLIAGGMGKNGVMSSAEVYDPSSGRITAVGDMNAKREGHTATLLKDGKVLITGGSNANIPAQTSAELYDPATGKFTRAGEMAVGRQGHGAILLPDGQVLVVGGIGLNPQHRYLASVELYNPATRSFKLLGEMLLPRFGPTLTLLGDGEVLVTGRFAAPGYFATAATELYQPTKAEQNGG